MHPLLRVTGTSDVQQFSMLQGPNASSRPFTGACRNEISMPRGLNMCAGF